MIVSDKVLERARKLHALTQSSNEHEAAVAAAKLQEMLFKFNISEGLLEEAVEQDLTQTKMRHDRSGGLNWRRTLIHVVAKYNFCDSVYTSGTDVHRVFGAPHNVEFVLYLYNFLSDEIVRLADIQWSEERLRYKDLGIPKWQQSSALRWKNGFKHGAVYTINQRLKEQHEQSLAEHEQVRALVLDHQAALSRFVREQVGATRETSHKVARDGWADGKEAGQGLTLNRPMPTSPTGSLALGAGK